MTAAAMIRGRLAAYQAELDKAVEDYVTAIDFGFTEAEAEATARIARIRQALGFYQRRLEAVAR